MNLSLFDVILMQENDLFVALEEALKANYKKIISRKFDYIYAVGRSKLCLVAHIDTFRNNYQKIDLKRINNILINKNGVLGADDRAGVYAILKIVGLCNIRKIHMPSVIFANQEELGGLGIRQFLEDQVFQGKTDLWIELDRRHANDYCFYSDYLPKRVKEYVESFGFVESRGIFSDIFYLSEAFRIPGINLSIGFYNEHTDHERLHLDELYLTIHRVLMMLNNPIRRLYLLQKKKSYYEKNGSYKNTILDLREYFRHHNKK